MTPADLIAFEEEVAAAFRDRKIRGPVHLSGGNEETLIKVFREVDRSDWVLSTYRSHYHALLHGVPRAQVMEAVLSGRSMNLSFPEHRFLTSAIVGGLASVSVGIAAGIMRRGGKENVWCFVGDMAASIGAFEDARKYAMGHSLPVTFVIEDNGLSCDSQTRDVWGHGGRQNTIRYQYERRWPHVGTGEFVDFGGGI